MTIVAHLSHKGVAVADVTYRPGFLVDVRVAAAFLDQNIFFRLSHSNNEKLAGTWEEALDNYFNNGIFHAKADLFPGEMRRVGCANEHRSLFQHAVYALLRDLEPHGYEVNVEFP
jgi:hypothetical protein